MNISRDLFLLSAIAFQQGQYDKAASLFASSMSSEDSDEFLEQVDNLASDSMLSDLNSQSSSKGSLKSIAQIIKSSMMATVEASDDIELDDAEDIESSETETETELPSEEDSDDLESDDDDPDTPGEHIIPSALSSVNSAIKVK